MKKKILILLIGLTMIIGVTIGCTDDEQDQAENTMTAKQDTVEVVGVAQIEDELGVKIMLPAIIKDENCSIVNAQTGIITYQYNSVDYTYYVEAADAEADATGMAESLPNPDTVLADNATYKIAYETDGTGVTYWYDKNNKVACTLLVLDSASPDDLKAMTESIISVQ